jgi:hypothetical protein
VGLREADRPIRPISLRSPKAGWLIGCPASGSSFQARYVSFGSLFREPLGTIPNMKQTRREVNKKRQFHGAFSQSLFLFLPTTCKTALCGKAVYKTD